MPFGGRAICAAERLLKVVEGAALGGEASETKAELRWRDEMGMRDLECGLSGEVLTLGDCCGCGCGCGCGKGADPTAAMWEDDHPSFEAAKPVEVVPGRSLLALRCDRLASAFGSTASKNGVLPRYQAVGVRGDRPEEGSN